MSEYTEQDWRNTYRKGGVGTCMSPSWLLNGCPVCGGTHWEVTSDYHAYCEHCLKGYTTSWPFTHSLTAYFDADGYHCSFCRGYAEAWNGEPCFECGNQRTQPIGKEPFRRVEKRWQRDSNVYTCDCGAECRASSTTLWANGYGFGRRIFCHSCGQWTDIHYTIKRGWRKRIARHAAHALLDASDASA